LSRQITQGKVAISAIEYSPTKYSNEMKENNNRQSKPHKTVTFAQSPNPVQIKNKRTKSCGNLTKTTDTETAD